MRKLTVFMLGALSVQTALASQDYMFKHPLTGLKASAGTPTEEAPEEDSGACIDASSAALGTISDNFCQSPGDRLVKGGDIEGRQIFFDADVSGVALMGFNNVDMAGVPNVGSNWLSNPAYSDGRHYTDVIHNLHVARGTNNQDMYTTELCLNKGEGWYLPTPHELQYSLKLNEDYIDLDQLGYGHHFTSGATWFAAASETTNAWIWAFKFDGKGGNNLGKTVNTSVVCAKDIILM